MGKLLHIITGLNPGGAERMLARLAGRLRAQYAGSLEQTVVSLLPPGDVTRDLEAAEIAVRGMDMRQGTPSPVGLWRLAGVIREIGPDLIQTWMYAGDLAGSTAARLARPLSPPPVVWGLHNLLLDADTASPTTRMTVKACASLSRTDFLGPKAIVSCSHAAVDAHMERGYRAELFEVIPNGFDTETFTPAPQAGPTLRAELGIPPDAPVVACVTRDHPHKDLPNLFRAFALLRKRVPAAVLVACGPGITLENDSMRRTLADAGLDAPGKDADNLRLLGPRRDVARILAGADVAVSPSAGESMPLAVGEAMACGTPCVVTDTGDSARLVGDTGRVVPTRDAPALAQALADLLALRDVDRAALQDLGLAARARIANEFSLDSATRQYAALYARLAPSLLHH